jgi:hypothetical protein
MKRFCAGLLCGIALACGLILTGVPGVLPGMYARMDQRATNDWQVAKLLMLRDTAFLACAGQEDIRHAAQIRGWEVEIINPDTAAMPRQLQDAHWALRIHTRPAPPLATEPGDIYGFDSRGCLMR